MTIDYVIADYKTPELAERAAATIEERCGVEHTTVVIDAAETGESYSQAINRGVALGSGEVVCALNADVECLSPQWPVLELFGEDPRVAVVGPRQRDSMGLVRHAGIFGTNEMPAHRFWGVPLDTVFDDCAERCVDCVTVSGSVYYARRETWEQLGGFLETPHYYEETWFSYLARHRGFRVVYTGAVTWLHHWARAPVDDPWKHARFAESRELFRAACAREGIVCD